MAIRELLAFISGKPIAPQKIWLTSDVFVAGPTPDVTFVDRSSSPEFREITLALHERGKIISLTGPSKTGKTVISVKQVLRDRAPIQVHSAKITSVEAFWDSLRAELRLPKKKTLETSTSERVDKHGEAKLRVGVSGGGVEAAGGVDHRDTTKRASVDEYDANTIAEVETALKEIGSPIVIDDFHWVTDSEVQVGLFKSLRHLLQNRISVILTSVTELDNKPWRAVPDLALLCKDIKIPHWAYDQLIQIARQGFAALGAEIDERTLKIMARYAYRNPMLMQDYCRRLAFALEIDQTLKKRRRFTVSDEQLTAVLRYVAEDKGKLYASFCEGRGEANWTLTSGKTVSIYLLLALALSRVWVMVPISVDALTRRMRKLLASEADRERLINVTVRNAADQISRDMLAALETRAPLGFDQSTNQLNILDPFFKVYLTWQLSPKYLDEHPPLSPGEPPDN